MEFSDNYHHEGTNTIYIVENIYTDEILLRYNGEELRGCNCEMECLPEKCSCLKQSGAYYNYLDKSNIKSYQIQIINENKPVFECNENCTCKNNFCGNRLVQFGPRNGLKVIETNNKGYGLTTTNRIASGNFICEYAGEVITENETQKRFKVYKEKGFKNNYIFCINESIGNNKNIRTFIDPTFYGNIGRYINHSCQPNSYLIPIRINDLIPKLCIFAKEAINNDQEITFNYGEVTVDVTIPLEKRKRCFCSSSNCSNYLPYDPSI